MDRSSSRTRGHNLAAKGGRGALGPCGTTASTTGSGSTTRLQTWCSPRALIRWKKTSDSSKVRDREASGTQRVTQRMKQLRAGGLGQESITGAALLPEPGDVPWGWGRSPTSRAAAQNTAVLKAAPLSPGTSGNSPSLL